MNHSPNIQCPDRQSERERETGNFGEVGEEQKETDREAWHTFYNGGKVQQLMMSSVLQSLFAWQENIPVKKERRIAQKAFSTPFLLQFAFAFLKAEQASEIRREKKDRDVKSQKILF